MTPEPAARLPVTYEFFDHTGDLGVRLRGATRAELFAAAAAALTAALVDPATVRPADRRDVDLTAPTDDGLLVDWLSELLYLFEVHDLLVASAEVTVDREAERWRLHATIDADRFDPARHRIKLLIKGVTYHRLAIAESEDGFETDLILDI